MDNPEKGIVHQTANQVNWVSTTTGDDDGVDIRIDAPVDAVLKFRTPIIDLDVEVAELADGETKEYPAGGVDLMVKMRRLPSKDTTTDVSIDVTDDAPPKGKTHAYWIRVTQEDGAQAWTSPVYLDA
jgi:hypothetical protein